MDGEFLSPVLLVAPEDAEWATGQARGFVIQPEFTVVICYADHAMVHELRPVSATQTRFHIHWFVNEETDNSAIDVDNLIHVWDMTRQDVALVERAQLGLKSRRYSPRPLSVEHEPGIRAALDTYLDIMGDHEIAIDLMERANRHEAL